MSQGRLLAGGLLLLAASVCSAQRVDLVAVYRLSLDHDPRLKAAAYRYEAAQESVPLARSLLRPNLSFDADYVETDQNIRSSDNAVFATGSTDFPTGSYGLTLSQPIFQLADWKRLKQSHAEVALAFAEYTAEEQDLVLRVAERYLGVLAAGDDLRFTEAERVAVEEQRELAQTRRASGLAPVTDEYDANARHALVLADAAEAANRLDDAIQALLESTGMLIDTVTPMGAEIPLESPDPLDVEQWIDLALVQNAELLAREQALEVARHEIDKQTASRYPTLNFLTRFDERDTEGSLFGGGSDVGTTEFAIQLKVPLFGGGATRSNVRRATLMASESAEQLKLERLIVSRETRGAYLGVLSGIARINALSESLLAQRSSLDAKRRGYGTGLNTALDVLDAERDLYRIERDHAQARYDYVLSTLRLKRAAGTLTAADLQRVNELLAGE